MKKLKGLLLLGLVFCCFFALAGCGAPKLDTPTGLSVDMDTLTLEWKEVPNAVRYSIDLGGTREVATAKNAYSLASLLPGEYQIAVKAVGNGNEYDDSKWSEAISFVKEEENGIRYELTNLNTEYRVSAIGSASGEIVIPETYRGKPVTAIADKAFMGSGRITGIEIGKNVKTIGTQAFFNCSLLAKVVLPENLVSLGEQAFQNCRALTELTIPGTLKTISGYAFAYCRALTELTISEGVEQIKENAFAKCTSLKTVTLPTTLTTLEAGAFADDSELQAISIGDKVTGIGNSAFANCTALSEVNIGNSVSSIGSSAFSYCLALTEVSIPNTVVSIGSNAFVGDSALGDVRLGGGITSIGENAFFGTKIWTETDGLVYIDNWLVGMNTATSQDGKANENINVRQGTVGIADAAFYSRSAQTEAPVVYIEIPAGVKYIGNYAFAYRNQLTQFIIQNGGVEHIGNYAFFGCAVLDTIQLGDSLKTIGNYAFRGCTMLNDISLPQSLETIGTWAFYDTGIWQNTSLYDVVYADNWVVGCKDFVMEAEISPGTVGISNYAFYQTLVNRVTVPDSVKLIGKAAFYECEQLRHVTLPDGLKRIEDYTFYGCSALYDMKIPSGVESIGRSAFYQCVSYENIELPDSVQSLGDYCFYGSRVTAIRFGAGIKSIGSRAFQGSGLQTVTIPGTLENIPERAFAKSSLLQHVILGEGVKTVGRYAFTECLSLVDIVLPQSLEKIGDYAFYKCTSLTAIDFGGTSEIGNSSFFGCSALRKIVIPQCVKKIGNSAFRNCSLLESVILPTSAETLGSHLFNGCDRLVVYAESAEAPEGWNTRWNSAYRSVLWGCTLSANKDYVVSFTKTETSLENSAVVKETIVPRRNGYTFDGWAQTEGGKAMDGNLADLPDGTVVYTRWKEGDPVEYQPPVPEEPAPQDPDGNHSENTPQA